jgi:hypothetical protein
MELERIEQVLRAGPPDEPVYIPGSFRQARRPGAMLAAVGLTVAAVLVLAVVTGVVLTALRLTNGQVGGPVDVDDLHAQLQGTWLSTELTENEWVDGLVALGYDPEQVEASLSFLEPFEVIRYEMVFDGTHLQIFGSYDDGPFESFSGGPYELLSDGAIHYDDIGCFITATFDITGDQLQFDPIQTEGCVPDASLNNAVFFNLVTYTRGGS